MRISGAVVLKMLDVGQGDSFYIQTKEGQNILIDTGDSYPKFKTSINGVEKNIFGYRRKVIDLIFITHDDADHVGVIEDIVSEYKVGAVISSPLMHGYIDRMMKKGEVKNPSMHHLPIAVDGVSFNFGNEKMDVVYPRLNEIKSKVGNGKRSGNEDSVISILEIPLLSRGSVKVLFTGDAGVNEEKKLLDEFIQMGSSSKIDILKVGHHGSKTSTSKQLLEVIAPNIALISVGLKNSYGHPHKKVMDVLTQFMDKSQIYRTDFCGTAAFVIYKTGAIGHRFCESISYDK